MTALLKPLIVAAACLVACASQAQTTLSGVRYDASTELRSGMRVQLNGAGTRYRGPIKVYTAGLYLTRKTSSPEDVLGATEPKRLAVTMLRDIDASELGKLFIRSVEDNLDRTAFSRVIPGLMRMSQIFTDNKKLAAGDSLTIDWVPGVGTVISVRGVPQGEPFREPEFYAALMRIWIGPVPADWQLKEQLLGRPLHG
jgi:hypothetical protein